MEANSCTKIGIWETWPFEKTHLVFYQEFDLVNHLCFILNFKNIFNLALLLTIGFQMTTCKVSNFVFIKIPNFSENSMK